MYGKPHLDQVLFSIGLTFMAVAAVDYAMGSQQVNVQTPEWLRGRFEFGADPWMLGMGAYRLPPRENSPCGRHSRMAIIST